MGKTKIVLDFFHKILIILLFLELFGHLWIKDWSTSGWIAFSTYCYINYLLDEKQLDRFSIIKKRLTQRVIELNIENSELKKKLNQGRDLKNA